MNLDLTRIDRAIWRAIYGGMFLLGLGLVLRHELEIVGWVVVVLGAAALVAGIVGIWIRSRLPDSGDG